MKNIRIDRDCEGGVSITGVNKVFLSEEGKEIGCLRSGVHFSRTGKIEVLADLLQGSYSSEEVAVY